MDCRKVLENNYKCLEGSFVYFLHEEAKFDKDSFWEYYYCIKYVSHEEQVSKEIYFTYRYVLESFLYHFDPEDLYRIKYFPRKKYNLYLERIKFAADAYFEHSSYDEKVFGNELRKPYWVN
ncbi:MAG: hypothetical protein ACRDBO_03230 [Lachnospiraceae bacterium]